MVVYQLVKTRLKYGEITRNAVMDIDRLGVMAPILPKESAKLRTKKWKDRGGRATYS
jgi:hypothetical protein